MDWMWTMREEALRWTPGFWVDGGAPNPASELPIIPGVLCQPLTLPYGTLSLERFLQLIMI